MTDEENKKQTEAPAKETKPEPEPAFVITQEELDRLVGAVKTQATPDNKEIYEKALNEARAAFETAQNDKLEQLARKAETERIALLEQEIANLKHQQSEVLAGVTSRKGIVNTTNPFKKTDDGKTAIRRDALEEATRKRFFPQA
jgi:uncharacterized small protein (DUF1192 family)